MAEIIQCYREAVPAMRFIGRKYDGFTSWGECFSTDTFGAIERAMGGVEAVRALWKDGGYVGWNGTATANRSLITSGCSRRRIRRFRTGFAA